MLFVLFFAERSEKVGLPTICNHVDLVVVLLFAYELTTIAFLAKSEVEILAYNTSPVSVSLLFSLHPLFSVKTYNNLCSRAIFI